VRSRLAERARTARRRDGYTSSVRSRLTRFPSPARSGRLNGAGLLIAGILALALNLRAMITSVPPLFPELSSTLGLSSAVLAVLAAVPVLCFGAFSGLAAPLSRLLGEERVLGWALVLLTAGLLLRCAAPGWLLFPGTVLACGSVALMNVLLPSMIKRRSPDRAGLLIGLYLMAMSGGAIIASLIAVPVFDAAGGREFAARLSLGLWAAPAAAAALAWLPQLRLSPIPGRAGPPVTRHGAPAMARYPLAWQVMAFMGLQSLFYYASISWFPTLLRDRGVTAALAGGLLALMNLGNAVTALVVPVLAHRAADQRMLVVAAIVADAVGLAGGAFGPLAGVPAFVLVMGLGQGATLGLGIFFTMARAPDPGTAASLSGFAQGAGYLLASIGPLAVGLLHAATGGWTVPMLCLLATVAAQLATGLLAGRNLMVPAAAIR
jgi:CP family cyanate transporter-like MFS transporter